MYHAATSWLIRYTAAKWYDIKKTEWRLTAVGRMIQYQLRFQQKQGTWLVVPVYCGNVPGKGIDTGEKHCVFVMMDHNEAELMANRKARRHDEM